MSILETINSSADVKKLRSEELAPLCAELRDTLVETVSKTGGHLASNLGVVELTVALHRVYDSSRDRIVFDVGHQCYVHKLLTGRRDRFDTLRRLGGLSGFPKPYEAEDDAFIAGHSSNSISVALGMARARTVMHEDYDVVAVIGDGAMTGGLAFEGLNNAGASPATDILVVLNDNEMSIDKPTGALDRYLVRMSTSKWYNALKRSLWRMLGVVPALHRFVRTAGNAVKQGLLQNSNLFESLNFRYFGPVDGHNIEELIRTLTALKEIGGPKLLHIKTRKGKGYAPAEADPATWHAPGRFDATSGERIRSTYPVARYQDVFGTTLLDLARRDERIVGITPAMPSGCSLSIVMREMPERCFDVGIAEGHAVTFSAGLAAGGARPFCNIYSSFMQRAYDNLIHDVALQNLPVVLCLDRSGIVGEDGATHHGAFDLAYLGCVPNITIAAPRNEWLLRQMMFTASTADHPTAIRYPRGIGEGVEWQDTPFELLEEGRGEQLRDGSDIAIIAVGTMANVALRAAERSEHSVAVYDLRYVKPLDEELLLDVGRRFKAVITIEDGIIRGGVGESVAALLQKHDLHPKMRHLGINDRFVEHGKPAELYAECGYDEEALLRAITEITNNR